MNHHVRHFRVLCSGTAHLVSLWCADNFGDQLRASGTIWDWRPAGISMLIVDSTLRSSSACGLSRRKAGRRHRLSMRPAEVWCQCVESRCRQLCCDGSCLARDMGMVISSADRHRAATFALSFPVADRHLSQQRPLARCHECVAPGYDARPPTLCGRSPRRLRVTNSRFPGTSRDSTCGSPCLSTTTIRWDD